MLLSFFLTLLFRKAMTQQFKNSKQQTGGQIIIKKKWKKKLAERALGCGQNERYRNRSRERTERSADIRIRNSNKDRRAA